MKKIKWYKILICVVAALILVVGGYVAYVLLTYSRIPDNTALTVTGNASEKAKTGEEYTITSYNLGFGAYTADYSFFMDGGKESRARSKESVNTCINGCADIVLQYSPDIAIFQEVDTDSTRSFHIDQTAMVNEKFEKAGQYDNVFACNYHSAYLMYPLIKPHGASNSGLLTESRFDVTSSLRRSLPIATSIKKILDLDRAYSVSRIPVENGKELIIINLHLSAYGTDAAQGNAQMDMVFSEMKKEYEAGNYVITGGDFNHDFTGTSKEYFNPGFTGDFSWCNAFPADSIPEGFSRCMDYSEGLVPSTRNADIPYSLECFTVILDGFLISDNITCTYVQNLDEQFKYTDHNPVVMKFILKDE